MPRRRALGEARKELLCEQPCLVDPSLRDLLNDHGLEGSARLLTSLCESTRQQLRAGVRTSIRADLVAKLRGLVELAVRHRRLREHDQDLGRRGAIQANKMRPRASRISVASRGEPKRELHRRGRQRLAREVIPKIQCILICRELIDQQREEGPRCCFCAAG